MTMSDTDGRGVLRVAAGALLLVLWLGPARPARAEAPHPATSRVGTSGAIPRVVVTTAQMSASAPDVVIPGDIEARYQSNISFRVNGRIRERLVEVGAHVAPDQVLARIEPEQQEAALRDAEAALAAAEASLAQATVTFARQAELMKGRYTTQTAFDAAEQGLRTTQAQVESGRARLGSVREQLTYTELRAGVPGIVTARNAEVGQVVRQGETVFTIAQDGPRDAVFNVYEGLLASPPKSREISVVLLADPAVRVAATVREIAPTVDPANGAVKVKATLTGDAPGMTLGASVVGLGNLDASQAVTLPWSALFRWGGEPAVWIHDPRDGTVSPRRIAIEAYAGTGMVLRDGVAAGDRVVTAGIQFLRPGQRVAVVEGAAP